MRLPFSMVAECQPEMSPNVVLNLLTHQFDQGPLYRPAYAKSDVVTWVLNLTELVDVRTIYFYPSLCRPVY